MREKLHILRIRQESGGVNTAAGDVDYTQMPTAVRKSLSEWDLDGNGHVNLNEVLAAHKHQEALQKSNRRYHYVIPLLALGLILSCIVTFVMAFAAAESCRGLAASSASFLFLIVARTDAAF